MTALRRPNVVVILADDLGFSDIEPFGGEIQTPALSGLAATGVSMSSFYVTPRCSPSRAALLTGRVPHEVGIGILTSDDSPTGYPGSLSTEVPTLAELLSEQGYATGIFGKWHLSNEVHVPCATWPTRRGFDEFRGILSGASSFFEPPIVEGEEPVPVAELSEDFYFTDDITNHAVDFIRRHAEDSEPFFLYLPYTAPHGPLHARPEAISKYRELYAAGQEPLRSARLDRLHEKGLVPEVHTLPPSTTVPEWNDDEAAWQIERMAVYAAQVDSLDQGVGRILDSLEEMGVREDTLVMFLSDNGACAETMDPEIVSHVFSELVAPRTTRQGEPVTIGDVPGVMPGPATTYQGYGRDWATVSNTPFRMWKRWVHEGGISSPFVVSWPSGGIKGGGISHALGHINDILPTVLDASGLGSDGPGTSLLKVWENPGHPEGDRTLCWEHLGNAAIRRGRWKLVREWGSAWELYDIETDRIESSNLVAQYPDLVDELEAEWQAWADAHGVIPWQVVLDDYQRRGKGRLMKQASKA